MPRTHRTSTRWWRRARDRAFKFRRPDCFSAIRYAKTSRHGRGTQHQDQAAAATAPKLHLRALSLPTNLLHPPRYPNHNPLTCFPLSTPVPAPSLEQTQTTRRYYTPQHRKQDGAVKQNVGRSPEHRHGRTGASKSYYTSIHPSFVPLSFPYPLDISLRICKNHPILCPNPSHHPKTITAHPHPRHNASPPSSHNQNPG